MLELTEADRQLVCRHPPATSARAEYLATELLPRGCYFDPTAAATASYLPRPVATGPSGPPEAPPASQGRPLKVLYLFSGVAHKLDMATCLQQLTATWALDLRTECVDIKRSAKQDLSLPKVRDSYLDRIRAKEFDAILLSPALR